MAIHDRIKEARVKNGYTQKELGDLIGVAKSTVAGYETGNTEKLSNFFERFGASVMFRIVSALKRIGVRSAPQNAVYHKIGIYHQEFDN